MAAVTEGNLYAHRPGCCRRACTGGLLVSQHGDRHDHCHAELDPHRDVLVAYAESDVGSSTPTVTAVTVDIACYDYDDLPQHLDAGRRGAELQERLAGSSRS
jgi:hypothetical protein